MSPPSSDLTPTTLSCASPHPACNCQHFGFWVHVLRPHHPVRPLFPVHLQRLVVPGGQPRQRQRHPPASACHSTRSTLAIAPRWTAGPLGLRTHRRRRHQSFLHPVAVAAGSTGSNRRMGRHIAAGTGWHTVAHIFQANEGQMWCTTTVDGSTMVEAEHSCRLVPDQTEYDVSWSAKRDCMMLRTAAAPCPPPPP